MGPEESAGPHYTLLWPGRCCVCQRPQKAWRRRVLFTALRASFAEENEGCLASPPYLVTAEPGTDGKDPPTALHHFLLVSWRRGTVMKIHPHSGSRFHNLSFSASPLLHSLSLSIFPPFPPPLSQTLIHFFLPSPSLEDSFCLSMSMFVSAPIYFLLL